MGWDDGLATGHRPVAESSLWLLEGSGAVSGEQGWPVELGHEQAKLESLATAAGLCRRVSHSSLSHVVAAWRVWQ
jgi:hypothetical protein